MIVTSALIIWKALMCITGSESPVVVVLSASMEPGFKRGDILFLRMSNDPIRAGEIVVFNVDVHERQQSGAVDILTKGDNNFGDDRLLYAHAQLWLHCQHSMGRAVGFLPYVGWVTIIMTEKPIIKRGAYKNMLDALVKIVQEEGPAELYRGLTPSLIGVIPYAATNYYAYDTLRKAYQEISKQEEIGNIATLLIGSAAGAISGSVTFPLEVAWKHMQAGAHYKNLLHALMSIVEREGVPGLYRGLRPSCLKLVPAAGISFMCYEACKRILVEHENDDYIG